MGVTFDSPNLGVGALLGGSISAILSNYPNAQISVLDYGYDPFRRNVRFGDRDVAIDFVNLRFSKKLFLPNNIAYLIALALLMRVLPIKSLRDRIINRNSTLSSSMKPMSSPPSRAATASLTFMASPASSTSGCHKS